MEKHLTTLIFHDLEISIFLIFFSRALRKLLFSIFVLLLITISNGVLLLL